VRAGLSHLLELGEGIEVVGTAENGEVAVAKVTPARRWVWSRPLIASSALMAGLVLFQAFLAGSFLTGTSMALDVHREMAFAVIIWVAITTLVSAVLWWKPGGGPAWPIAVALLSAIGVTVQIIVGFLNLLQVHIPLGVSREQLPQQVTCRIAFTSEGSTSIRSPTASAVGNTTSSTPRSAASSSIAEATGRRPE
jgi:hypothetical protein